MPTPRVTAGAVQECLLDDYDVETSPALKPFIATADGLVDDILEYGLKVGVVIDDSRAKEISKWLAAHFYKCSDKKEQSVGVGGSNSSFQGQTGMYFESTDYGQTAVVLDKTGYLKSLSTSSNSAPTKKAGGFWAGVSVPESTDWNDWN